MTHHDLAIAPSPPLKRNKAVLVILGCLFVAMLGVSFLLRRSLTLEAMASKDLEETREQASRLAIDRGISLCQSGQVPSGLLWLGHSLELAPPDDADLQRIIRTNLTAWSNRTATAIDILMHGATVQAVAESADASTLATAGSDGRVCVWKLGGDSSVPGIQVSCFKVGDPPTAYSFNSTGKLLVTGSDDGTIRFFDVATGAPLSLSIHQAGTVSAAAFSFDGSFLVTGSAAGIVRRWDLQTGKLLGEANGHTDWVLSLAISPDGRYFVSGGNDGIARLWMTDTTEPAGPPIKLVASVTGVAFSPDSTRFMTVAGYNASIFQTTDMQLVGEPIRHSSMVRSAAFDPTGAMVVTGCRDGFIRVWNSVTHAPAISPIRCMTSIHLVSFSPEGKSIISAGDAPAARLWRLPAGDQPLRTINAVLPVTSLAFSPDGASVVVGTSSSGDPGIASEEGSARLFRVDTGKPDSPPFATGAGVVGAMFSEDGKSILTGDSDNNARLWSAADLTPIGQPLHYDDRLRAVALAAKVNTILASGAQSSQGDVKIWKYESTPVTDQVPRIIDQDQSVLALALSPDQTRLVTGCGDGGAREWTLETGQTTGIVFGHQNQVTAVIFRPDGKAIASGDQNGTVRVWDSRSGLAIAPAIQNPGPVTSVDFTPDGNTLAISTMTATMKYLAGWGTGTSSTQLWDARSGIAIGPIINSPSWAAWRAAISPDGKLLAIGSADGLVRFYPMPVMDHAPVADILARLQLAINRRLDENQTELPLYTADWLDRRKRGIKRFGDD